MKMRGRLAVASIATCTIASAAGWACFAQGQRCLAHSPMLPSLWAFGLTLSALASTLTGTGTASSSEAAAAGSAAAAAAATAAPAGAGCRGVGCLQLDNSWVAKLTQDPDAAANAPNTQAREVRAGHFVLVSPTPLPQPVLVATSREMAEELGLRESDLQERSAVRLLSGDVAAVPSFNVTWATPYALSIYGQKVIPGGSGKEGDGYGDGRAISIGEVLVPTAAPQATTAAAQATAGAKRWELQLKGGGRTPFARNADGRAILRYGKRRLLCHAFSYENR